jgi:hypothetical protein
MTGTLKGVAPTSDPYASRGFMGFRVPVMDTDVPHPPHTPHPGFRAIAIFRISIVAAST